MTRIIEAARVIRSKNAGPFELTLDIIFRDAETYRRVRQARAIKPALVAPLYRARPEDVRVIYFDPALAVKITMPRECPSGSPGDADIYGAQQHAPLLDLVLEMPAPSGPGRGGDRR